jgi:uncharacterized membrane protein
VSNSRKHLPGRNITRPSVPQRVADAITSFSGSIPFVILHLAWFALWIGVNTIGGRPFDPFPFGLLTLIVSLEAIFLSTFVLISQNRQSGRSDERAMQDFETNIYSEALSELISERLGISASEVEVRYKLLRSAATRQDEANPKT